MLLSDCQTHILAGRGPCAGIAVSLNIVCHFCGSLLLSACSMGSQKSIAWPVRPLLEGVLRLQDALPSIPETVPMSTQSSPQKEVRQFSALTPEAALLTLPCLLLHVLMMTSLCCGPLKLYEPQHSLQYPDSCASHS